MNRNSTPVKAIEREVIAVPLTLTILGNTTPANGTFTVVQGKTAAASVARTGTGKYRVTLRDAFPTLLGAVVSIAPHNDAARGVKMSAVTPASKTADFVIVNTAEAALDTPNAETDTVYLTLFFKNSTVK